MTVIAVMYPDSDGASFDQDYYMRTHIPLVRRLWEPMGLTKLDVLRGTKGPDGAGPTYSTVALLSFGSIDQFKEAAARHGREIFADIPNFSSASPIVQFNEIVG